MTIYSLAEKTKLIAQINELKSKIENREEGAKAENLTPLLNRLNEINQFHEDIQNNSYKKFKDLERSLKEYVNIYDNPYNKIYKPLYNVLIESFNNIKLPDIEGASDKIRNQYRYAFALAWLAHYNEYIKANFPSLNLSFMTEQLKNISEEDVLSLLPNQSINEALYQGFIDKKAILFRYDDSRHKLAIQAAKEEAAKEAKYFQEYKANLQKLEEELIFLRTDAATQSSPSNLLKNICDYGDEFVKALEKDSNYTISYENANTAVTETQNMIKGLKAALQPQADLTTLHNQIQGHANNLLALTDKRKDVTKNSALGWALLITAAILLTFSILALIACTQGTFLGVAFATTMMVKSAAGTLIAATTPAADAAFFAGYLGTLSSIGLGLFGLKQFGFFADRPNKIKSTAEKFTDSALKAVIGEEKPTAPAIALKKI